MGLCNAIYALLRYGIIVVEADKTAKRVCVFSLNEIMDNFIYILTSAVYEDITKNNKNQSCRG